MASEIPKNQRTSRLKKIINSLFIDGNDVGRVILMLWFFSSIGLVCLIFPALAKFIENDFSGGYTVIGVGLFVAGASTLFGAVIGFLFGVPRKNLKAETNAGSSNRSYTPNTNLEQISDWLTKIIVGVGLTQIPEILALFERIGEYVGPSLGEAPVGPTIAIAITVHYILVGFVQGFLLAYLWLPGAFKRANKENQIV